MVKLNRYIIRLAKELSRKRVACVAIFHFLYYFDWLFFSGIFIKQIVYFLENGFSFQEIMWFIAGTVCVFSLVGMFNSWYENCVKPETDIDIYQGLYERIYAKAQNASLSCFEDTKFYDKYMMALEDADTRLITSIDNMVDSDGSGGCCGIVGDDASRRQVDSAFYDSACYREFRICDSTE